ncbi:MAG: 50S ribosomal protein L3 [Candidatus Yanofskybacteria bacterium RIFCSPHIGHO2_02_FULL_44_12b]|uniref:Large ribosomal subunit protein uL3 n=2 Tax=Candidatus Yanofskyibacteriota TaxID=1752733 RepID=A0A1F8GKF1_9BACT|nr:MAG: 50S ribosomal protein L3 [Candidatus Yanofskybacteria bacterium GW2011_GWA2_44_9]OGN04829.1 MAG: 50S ribosomal protein L3 [Candidatus Yanofskybacteria bacterium RIFCSPHIGHO2_01_FULL_44_24]OGN16075.1 MAG: 50S ribosomal protein L3 [Candidatus Yanofskybacteria bacterium RIFCSPHIGHO2_02_FULL_44_12b]OGN25146.1 MAG: 50S ribosomal protein L3 [Candidatus Yanofskybacteria bacterium RIFCSPLOWO2_01_FULL_44_22]
MKFILGKKMGMSQIYDDKGDVTPVTVIEAETNTVVQIRTKEKDKYEGVQVGFGKRKEKNVTKAQKGHTKDLGTFKVLKEFRTTPGELKRGDKLNVSLFAVGDLVKVTGMTKGKGFQGVVKRHGFSGMPASHGHHSVMRHAGSIGQRFPQHTLKGMRMPGRMGNDKFTVRGLRVVAIDEEKGLLAVKGAVPGNNGGVVMVQTQ